MNPKNDFQLFKEDFEEDTGITFSNENMATYIAYANLRVNGLTSKHLVEIKDKLAQLPCSITNEISEMLQKHKIIAKLKP